MVVYIFDVWMSNINILFNINYANVAKLSAEVPGFVPFCY